MNHPAIVVSAYNREKSLSRLLDSLDRAVYPAAAIKLIISVDKNDNESVYEIAKNHVWKHGTTEYLFHDRHMGLKEHILFCGDLTEEYKNVIILEDDLFVSPYFYEYTIAAQKFYAEENHVAGISLYSHQYNETAGMAFLPLINGREGYFMQIASSWGQSWTEAQWEGFRNWLDTNTEDKTLADEAHRRLPPDVQLWPSTSWKKLFIAYLMEADKYFFYPYQSYSTNFSDPGVHHKGGTNHFQQSLVYGKRNYQFPEFQNDAICYDSFCEIQPDLLKNWNQELQTYNFAVDLYGTKSMGQINEDYILTSRKCQNPEMSFGLNLKPPELNMVYKIQGEKLFLCKKGDVGSEQSASIHDLLNYYYSIPLHYIPNIEKIRQEFLQTASWKITKPLRFISRIIRKLTRGWQ